MSGYGPSQPIANCLVLSADEGKADVLSLQLMLAIVSKPTSCVLTMKSA